MERLIVTASTSILMALIVQGSAFGQTGPHAPLQTPSVGHNQESKSSDSEKLRRKVEGLGVGKRVTVVLRNGNEYYGAIGPIGADSFELSEIDLKQQITISYADVKKMRSGFGNPNPFNGKRWRPGWHIAGAAVAGGLLVVLIVAAATSS